MKTETLLILAGFGIIIYVLNSGTLFSMSGSGGLIDDMKTAQYSSSSDMYTLTMTDRGRDSGENTGDGICGSFAYSTDNEVRCNLTGGYYQKSMNRCNWDDNHLNMSYIASNYDLIGKITSNEPFFPTLDYLTFDTNCAIKRINNSQFYVCIPATNITYNSKYGLTICGIIPAKVNTSSLTGFSTYKEDHYINYVLDAKLIPKKVEIPIVKPPINNNDSNDGDDIIPCIIGCNLDGGGKIGENNTMNIGLLSVGVALVGISIFVLRRR